MTKQQLVEQNMNLVYHLIHRHYPTFVGDEDVVQAGMLGLCKAADNWDESKTVFSTYAGKCILNEINSEFRARKKHHGALSLDYEVTDGDGEKTTFGDFVVGEEDVGYIDFDPLYRSLSPVEQQIFDLRRKGATNSEIARLVGSGETFVQRKLRKIKALWRLMDGC
jgi:RNA polymerase sigma factor (sigma-70 family)